MHTVRKGNIFIKKVIYECRLRDWITVPGIRSREDFITFYKIVNGMTTGALSKYGEEKDGKMIYRLLADIDLNKTTINPQILHNDCTVRKISNIHIFVYVVSLLWLFDVKILLVICCIMQIYI